MKKQVYTIAQNELVAAKTYKLVLAPVLSFRPSDSLSFRPSEASGEISLGEFVNLEIPGFYLRRPISVCDAEGGRITLLYKTVGKGTAVLAEMPVGAEINVLTGLGRGFDADACKGEALLVAGGLGAAPLYLLAKRLKAQGKKVNVVLGFNKADEIVLVDEYKALCDRFELATLDGSAGVKGFVTDAIAAMQPGYDYFYTCGPMVMMRAVCGALEGSGEASLEERMGCGAGFCYCCSINTTAGTKRVCKDGPVFKKEEIIW